jgi:cytochrome c biogenesis protein
MLTEFQPVVRFRVWRGPLEDLTSRPLDTRFLTPVDGARGLLFGGESSTLFEGATGLPPSWPKDLSIRFADLRQYSVLQVSRDRGVPVVFLGAILILAGLLPALYTSRRKVWIRAVANGRGTVLEVGGYALQRTGPFEDEFARLVDDLTRAAEPAPR